MIYLYNYAGAPWKAQYWAREVMDRLYSACPDGYCGDEDNGQTSAWYVLSLIHILHVELGVLDAHGRNRHFHIERLAVGRIELHAGVTALDRNVALLRNRL